MKERIMRNETVKSNIPNTTVRAWRPNLEIAVPAGDESTLHYHDELEFICVYEGRFSCTVYDKEYIAEAGDVIFINARVPHSTLRLTPCKKGLLQFRESEFNDNEIAKIIKYSMRFQSQVYYPIKIFSSPALFDAINDIFDETAEKQKSYEIFIKSNIYRILGILYREGVLSDAERLYSTREIQKILPILSYVNANYAENITLEQVSDRLGFDQSYFCRIFKTATGATFTEYLNFVRICKAENMLVKTHDSILEISEAVGFSSVSYFNRIFKRYRNCSPRFYRTVVCCSM